MTPIEDARRILDSLEPHGLVGKRPGQDRILSVSGGTGYVYWFCDGNAPMADGHAPECPWVRRGRILAVLEAAERLIDWHPLADEPTSFDDNPRERSTYVFCGNDTKDGHADDCPWQALVAALRGKERTA